MIKKFSDKVPSLFLKSIKSDNFKFNEVIMQYEIEKIAQTILDKIKYRQDKITTIVNNSKRNDKREMINFNVYLIKVLNK